MKRILVALSVLTLALFVGVAAGTMTGDQAVDTQDAASLELPAEPLMQEAAGPPGCQGYELGDPCITPQNLAECRRAVRQCDGGPILVLESCPLQFRCGR